MPRLRNIIAIDDTRCTGCGQCATACAEGAIAIVDGKARLVSEAYCDGLGACLGECPHGALTIEQRPAEEFDEEAVARRLAESATPPTTELLACGCPGAAAQGLSCQTVVSDPEAAEPTSRLANWPVQIALVPPTAPYLHGAHLLVSADCIPFSFAGFHRRFLTGKVALVGCPKLDGADAHRDKLAALFRSNDIQSVEVAYMEVPCCSGLVRIVRDALWRSGKQIPITLTRVGIRGDIMDTVDQAPAGV